MSDGQPTDAQLMREVASGRREPLETLIRRHGSDLLNFIHRMVGEPHRRDDIFQDVFLAVWQKRRQYKYPLPFKSWLYGIAANRCREQFRKQARRPDLEVFHDESADIDSPDSDLIDQENRSIVSGAVLGLPEKQRTVVVMRIWDEMSYAEIAAATERTEGTVRSLMHHALNHLRQKLQARVP